MLRQIAQLPSRAIFSTADGAGDGGSSGCARGGGVFAIGGKLDLSASTLVKNIATSLVGGSGGDGWAALAAVAAEAAAGAVGRNDAAGQLG